MKSVSLRSEVFCMIKTSEYVKSLFKVLKSDNDVAKYILSIINIIKILFKNTVVFDVKTEIIFCPH